MATHMDVIRASVGTATIEASALATNMAVALTRDEIVTAKAGFWKSRIRRFPLNDLVSVREIPTPGISTLTLRFSGALRALTILFSARAEGFDSLVARLRQRLQDAEGARRPG